MTILYQDNFESDAIGQLPAGWAATAGTWEVGTLEPVSGTRSLVNTTGDNPGTAVYTSQGASTLGFQYDQKVTLVDNDGIPLVCPGAKLDAAFNNGYVVTLNQDTPGGGSLDASWYKKVSGTFQEIGAGSNVFTVAQGDTLHIRMSASNAGRIDVYMWVNSDALPTVPAISFGDDAFDAGGLAGFYTTLPEGITSAYPMSVDNVMIDDVGGAPTSVTPSAQLTLTGPSTGVVNLASAAFTVTPSAALAAATVVTPNDSSAGGTFTPPSLSFAQGATAGQTFTYTPTATGTPSISITNNAGLSNPSPLSYTVTSGGSSTTIPVPNADIVFSPGNWDTIPNGQMGANQTLLQSTAIGAYFKTRFSGSASFGVNFDFSQYADIPSGTLLVTANLDDGLEEVTLPVQQDVNLHTFFTDLSTGVHSVEVTLSASNSTVGSRWGDTNLSPSNVLRVLNVELDAGGTLSAPSVFEDWDFFPGDSISEGVRAAGTTVEPADHGKPYAWFIANALKSERCHLGYASTGWTRGGDGNMPPFISFWSNYSKGRPKTFATPPKRVWIMMGQNDGNTADVTTAALALIPQMRAAFPQAFIFLVPPPSGISATFLQAAVTQYRTATPGDKNVEYLDYLSIYANGGISGISGSATAQSVDSLHPLEKENGKIASALLEKANPYINKTRYFGVGGAWY